MSAANGVAVWTAEREALLRQLYEAGCPAEEILARVNRRPGFQPCGNVAALMAKARVMRLARPDASAKPGCAAERAGVDIDWDTAMDWAGRWARHALEAATAWDKIASTNQTRALHGLPPFRVMARRGGELVL